MKNFLQTLSVCFAFFLLGACDHKKQSSADDAIASLDLKKGAIISCGPAEEQFGNISFAASISNDLTKDFNTGVAMLHSFEYDEAEKIFASLIEKDAGLAMAYWGVAMANFHPLWAPPTAAELAKG